MSKYVKFLRLKTLKKALLGHFYCLFFGQPGENETHFIKNWEQIELNWNLTGIIPNFLAMKNT